MKTMQDVWDYIGKVMNIPNTYHNGYWGMFYNGKQAFDCVNIIKACGWDVPINYDIAKGDKYSYIANHKSDYPDVWIGKFYETATRKGETLATLPNDRFSFVYQKDATHNFSHIGLYNPITKTVREMVGGSVCKAREIPLSSVNYYHRWSNGAYFGDTILSNQPTQTKKTIDITLKDGNNTIVKSLTSFDDVFNLLKGVK